MSTCALVRRGPYPRLVENCIIAEVSDVVEPAYELVQIPEDGRIAPGWVLTEKGFRPGPGVRSEPRTDSRSKDADVFTALVIFDFEGCEQPVHNHDDEHRLLVKAGSFLLTVGKELRTIGPKDGEIILPADVPHGYVALEDDSIVLTTFSVSK